MQKVTKNSAEETTGGLGNVVFRYLPYWPLFLIFFLVAIVGAWSYLKYATPMFETTARVLIKDEKKGAEESKTLESLDLLSSKKIIENEMEVIQSRSLINEVVNKLSLYAPVSNEQSIKTLSAYTTSPMIVVVDDPEKLKETKKIYFTFDKVKQKVIINNTQYPLNEWLNTWIGKIRFQRNPRYINESSTAKLYFSLVSPKKVASGIEAGLKVTPVNKQSSIISLSYTDEVPQRGEDIINELLAAYNEASLKDKNLLAYNTQKFIQERLSTVEHDLDSIERKVQRYKSQSNAVDISTQGKLFLENVSNNDQKLSEINMQLAVLNQVEKYVYSKSGEGGIVPATLGVTDPTLSQLLDKLYTSELDYERGKKNDGENNPLTLSVLDRIQKIKPGILENIQSQRSNLLVSKNNISATNNTYSSVLQGMPEKERQLIDINREQSIKNEIYSFLLQKREETALSHVSNLPDSRIVDKAETADKPVSPKKKVIYVASVLLAFFSALGVVFAKETFSRKIMFRHEIEALTDFPVVGEISAEATKNPIVIGDNKRTFIAEQFRKLRITLNYIGVNTKRKRILVTSAISGEGKSFIASNLALSLAMTGKQVVLLDFDLNNPSLNNKLNLSEEKGITDYLLGEVEADDIIRKTDLHSNLYLIPTGDLPDNPSELIMSSRTEDLLRYLDTKFDYIVIDTAPIGPVTDAYVLSPLCDATLYIIRHGYTPKVFVERIDANNKINHLNNVAIVFNGVTSRGFGYKNYGYGYGYGYTYGNKEMRKRIPAGKN